jgi:hypothetical protein
MGEQHVVVGTLVDERTVSLDTAISLPTPRVRVILEPLSGPPLSIGRVIDLIREQQRARGYEPRSLHEIELDIQAERDSWGSD